MTIDKYSSFNIIKNTEQMLNNVLELHISQLMKTLNCKGIQNVKF